MQVRYYKSNENPGVMLPSQHHTVDGHGTIRRTFPKLTKKQRRIVRAGLKAKASLQQAATEQETPHITQAWEGGDPICVADCPRCEELKEAANASTESRTDEASSEQPEHVHAGGDRADSAGDQDAR